MADEAESTHGTAVAPSQTLKRVPVPAQNHPFVAALHVFIERAVHGLLQNCRHHMMQPDEGHT